MTTIEKYIASLDASVKVGKNEYGHRLALCADCRQLQNGVCGMCGCFVQVRAVKKNMSCPAVLPKW